MVKTYATKNQMHGRYVHMQIYLTCDHDLIVEKIKISIIVRNS